MNAITHKAAYSLFPKATFEKNLTLFTAVRETKHEEAIRKYIDRGWILKKSISSEEQRDDGNAPLRYEKRWVTDSKSWVIPLDTTGLDRNDDSLELGSFNLSCNLDDMMPEMRFTSVKDPLLSTSYVLNAECGIKVKAYIGLLKEMFERPNKVELEENIRKWSELCRNRCKCKLGGEYPPIQNSFIRRQFSNHSHYVGYIPLHRQMLICPAFMEMKMQYRMLRWI